MLSRKMAQRTLAGAALAVIAGAGCATAQKGTPMTEWSGKRVVCLGDSITDGNTYPQVLVQALTEAGRSAPVCICSGIASDTAPQMQARLEKTVLAFKPDLVTFSAGTNDAFRGVTPEAYEQSLRQIATRVKAAGASMILQTPCCINPAPGGKPEEMKAKIEKAAAGEATGDKFEVIIRAVAKEYGWPVAETRVLQRQARAAGKEIMSGDGIHPNYLGQQCMARAILDAMGAKDVPLPKEFAPKLFAGVAREWKMRPAPDKAPLSAAAVAALVPDASWKSYTLPDAPPEKPVAAEDWLEQCRRNGFGMQLEKQLGKGTIQAVAVLDEPRARQAWINTGIGVSTLWLNGVRLHEQGTAWTGFHAGKERYPVELKAGKNTIVCELGGQHFFVSVTDQQVWERP